MSLIALSIFHFSSFRNSYSILTFTFFLFFHFHYVLHLRTFIFIFSYSSISYTNLQLSTFFNLESSTINLQLSTFNIKQLTSSFSISFLTSFSFFFKFHMLLLFDDNLYVDFSFQFVCYCR